MVSLLLGRLSDPRGMALKGQAESLNRERLISVDPEFIEIEDLRLSTLLLPAEHDYVVARWKQLRRNIDRHGPTCLDWDAA